MEDLFKKFAAAIALGVESGAALIIAYGAVEAAYGTIRVLAKGPTTHGQRKAIRIRFGIWLLLALEFELAADIVRTAISPTWSDLGQLASIGFIRTFLNHFLEKDFEKYGRPSESGTKAEA
jgi:uncharacterized membrane protein